MALLRSLFIPFAFLLLAPSSIAVYTGYFCSSAALEGGSGTFSVYDTATSTTIGCLDENFRWVVDGSCATFTSTPEAIGSSTYYSSYLFRFFSTLSAILLLVKNLTMLIVPFIRRQLLLLQHLCWRMQCLYRPLHRWLCILLWT